MLYNQGNKVYSTLNHVAGILKIAWKFGSEQDRSHGLANATPGEQNAIFLLPLRIF